jgi:hypothetical protein
VTEVELLSFDGAHAIALWRNLVIQIYERPLATEPFLTAARRALGAFQSARAAVGPDGTVLALVVIAPEAPVPDAEVRAVMKRFPDYFDYVVTLTEGDDVRAAVIRLVNSGMALVARRRTKHDTVREPSAAIAHLVARSGGSFVAAEAEALLAALRARIVAVRATEAAGSR